MIWCLEIRLFTLFTRFIIASHNIHANFRMKRLKAALVGLKAKEDELSRLICEARKGITEIYT